MDIKEMRQYTNLSQGKFAELFHIPVSTLKDWEQGRRNPPQYVLDMIQTILEYKGIILDYEYVTACEKRRQNVESALAVIYTATNGPNKKFMDALNEYIYGNITLAELNAKVDSLEYLEV